MNEGPGRCISLPHPPAKTTATCGNQCRADTGYLTRLHQALAAHTSVDPPFLVTLASVAHCSPHPPLEDQGKPVNTTSPNAGVVGPVLLQ